MIMEYELDVVNVCPICNRKEIWTLIKKYDDRFGQPDMFEYCYCKNCDVAFLKDKIQEQLFSKLYKKYYGKNDRSTAQGSRLKTLLSRVGLDKFAFQWLAGNKVLLDDVADNARVLEVGSGYSPNLKKEIFSRKLQWTGLEVDEESVQNLKLDGLDVFHGTIKLNGIFDTYDYLISSQSLEHQYDINDFFESSKKFLRNGGKIIFTTPNFNSRYREKYGEKWINWHAPYHVLLLSRKGIESLSKKHGFVITKYLTYTPTSWFMLQSVFTIPEQGSVNENFNFNFSLLKQLIVSIFLKIFEFFSREDGDCIYCEIKLQ